MLVSQKTPHKLVDELFEDMIHTTNCLHMECLWFCFSSLFKSFVFQVFCFSSHYIRLSRHDTVAGKPVALYHLPESVGAANCIKTVTKVQWRDSAQLYEQLLTIAISW